MAQAPAWEWGRERGRKQRGAAKGPFLSEAVVSAPAGKRPARSPGAEGWDYPRLGRSLRPAPGEGYGAVGVGRGALCAGIAGVCCSLGTVGGAPCVEAFVPKETIRSRQSNAAAAAKKFRALF